MNKLYGTILHVGTRLGVSRFCTYATSAAAFVDSGSSEEDCCASGYGMIIQDKDLLRKSQIPNSPSGLHVLDLVDRGSLEADRTLFNKLLKKCTDWGKIREGRAVHSHVLRSEFKDDLVIHNTVLNMYVKCGGLDDARKLFEEMPCKDVVSWTALIAGYSQNDRAKDALVLCPQMLRLGMQPNQFTLSSLLKASGAEPNEKNGQQVHALSLKYGYDSNVYVGSSLVDMYARFGLLDEAQLIFHALERKNEVSWNALIAGHARKGQGEQALSLFQEMQKEYFKPTHFSYSSVFSVCASSGSLEQGKWVHAHAIKSGVKLVAFVGNTLLDMYSKLGSIEDARKVFDRLVKRDLVSWNSMLKGYARHGLGKETVRRFEEMLKIGIKPDDETFVCVLSACSHAGLLEEGQYYFELMKKYMIEAHVAHYVTIVDLFGRAGLLDRALNFIREMPVEPTAAVWKALLGACRMHKNMDLGAYAAERVFELDPYDSGPPFKSRFKEN